MDTSSPKAILHINRTPLPQNNVDAMIIFTCLHNMLEHNIVKGGRGITERTVNFTFLFKSWSKATVHIVFGQDCSNMNFKQIIINCGVTLFAKKSSNKLKYLKSQNKK